MGQIWLTSDEHLRHPKVSAVRGFEKYLDKLDASAAKRTKQAKASNASPGPSQAGVPSRGKTTAASNPGSFAPKGYAEADPAILD
jgi:hypothetical protein